MGVLSMPDPRDRQSVDPEDPLDGRAPEDIAADLKEIKKKDKVRAAWISFVGRIVAQIAGAAVTVALTLFVVQQAQQSGSRELLPAPAEAAATTATSRVSTIDAPRGGSEGPAELAIAVLPLANYSGDPRQDSFADGMTEALIAQLVQQKGFRVISRTSSMRYRGTRQALPEIARELGATHVIEGSVSRDEARVRITAQLIEAASDRHVWARSYDRPHRDVLALQTDVATEIAREVGEAFAAVERGRPDQYQAVEPEVLDLPLRGGIDPDAGGNVFARFEEAGPQDSSLAAGAR
jgi:TolB-like protein